MLTHFRFDASLLGLILSGVLASACGGTGASSGHAAASGGAGVGARGGADAAGASAQSGGASGTPTSGGGATQSGGATTGGASPGGASTGGAPPGGASTGGAPAGGASTGGATTGGAATGGAGAGGAPTGGASTGGATTGGASAAGAGGASGAGGAGGSDCPASPPAQGSPCTPPWEPGATTFGELVLAHCSWGDDPRPPCRVTATCEAGSWEVTTPDCDELLPPGCSSTPPESASTCTDTSPSCWYENGTHCWCSDCVGGSPYPVCQLADPPEWSCRTPAEGCYPLPQAGSACSDEGANCGLDCNTPLRCKDGRWQWLLCQSCCPICAAPDTPIATPEGEQPIAALRTGDLVYSVDDGAIRAVPLVQVGHTPVVHHQVMRIALDDGQVLEISPGHPTADGRRFGDLAPGSLLDDRHRVVSAELVPYRYDATYDILPASSTGTYFAGGALVGSTLNAR